MLKSEETSATDQIQLNQPKDKLTFGSKNNNKLTTGLTTQKNGSTNDQSNDAFICIYSFKFIIFKDRNLFWSKNTFFISNTFYTVYIFILIKKKKNLSFTRVKRF